MTFVQHVMKMEQQLQGTQQIIQCNVFLLEQILVRMLPELRLYTLH